MEHQKTAGYMSKFLKFLPRATSSVTFQNPPLYSPAKDKKSLEKPHKSNLGIGFSGPIVSIVPSDTRRKIKNDSTYAVVYEPTSPRVSCMGQVKCKHYRKLTGAANVTNKPTNNFSRTASYNPVRGSNTKGDQEKVIKLDLVVEKSKKKSGIWSLFRGGADGSRRKSDDATDMSKTALTLPKAPCLSTMKRFSSGRDAFMSFDWTTQVAPLDSAHQNNFTDDEKDGEPGSEEVTIPSSAPVMVRNKGICDNFVRVGGLNLQPRKEINLWKRRTMAQPQPLHVHAVN